MASERRRPPHDILHVADVALRAVRGHLRDQRHGPRRRRCLRTGACGSHLLEERRQGTGWHLVHADPLLLRVVDEGVRPCMPPRGCAVPLRPVSVQQGSGEVLGLKEELREMARKRKQAGGGQIASQSVVIYTRFCRCGLVACTP